MLPDVPDYIRACADAIYSDLVSGPARAILPGGDVTRYTSGDVYHWGDDPEDDAEEGDKIVSVYTGPIADALRAFIDDLPSALYAEEGDDIECAGTSEPEGEWIDPETGDSCDSDAEGAEWYDPPPYRVYDHDDIVAHLFGRTIAREFR